MSWRAQGLRTWIMQRLTAIYMLLYLLVFAIYFVDQTTIDYETWRQLFSYPAINIASIFFFSAILYHAWVGARDIMIDYVPWAPLRFSLWTLTTAALVGLAIWVVMILYSVVKL